MSYRSELAIVLARDVYNEYRIRGTLPDMLRDTTPEREDELILIWYWRGFNWIQFGDKERQLTALFEVLDTETREHNQNLEENDQIDSPYAFLRLGEDKNDTESRGDVEGFDLFWRRSIALPPTNLFYDTPNKD